MWRRRAWLLALLLVGLGGDAASATLGAATAALTTGAGAPSAGGLAGAGLGLGSTHGGAGGAVGTGLSAWPQHVFHHRPIYSHQSLQAVLASIEERLRALDALYSARYVPRLDLGVDPQSRRLDTIESRLGRLETLLELRLDKLTETISSRQLKDELAKDQLSRSVDATFERLHHRLGYMETRLDVTLTKLQTSMDSLSARVERLDAGLGGRHGDVGVDLLDVKSELDELRKSVHDNHESLLNSSARAAEAGHTAMQGYFERLSSTLDHMQEDLNRTLTVQNDGGSGGSSSGGGGGGGGGGGEAQLRHERHASSNLLSAVERHAASIGSKVTNMYNELWRRTQILEGLSKDAMALSNATRRELQEGLRSVSMQLNRYCLLQSDKAKPSSNTLESLEVTLEEMRARLGSDLQTMISTQNLFLQSCHRIQENEPHLDKFIAQALEKMLGFINSNKCQSHMEEVHRLLKSHHSTVVRSIGHNTNTILRAASNSSKETQSLINAMNEAHDGLLINTSEIQKSISGMKNEQLSVQQALGEITAVMNDLQDKLTDLANRSIPDGNYLKVIQCQHSNSAGHNISAELKRIFEENQKHISKEIHNLTQSIIQMLRSIQTRISPVQAGASRNESVKHDIVNILTVTNEHNYDNTPNHDITLEVHEENLNSIYDSQNPDTETSSVLQNLTDLNTIPHPQEHHTIQMVKTSSQLETTTSQYSNTASEDNISSPEQTINVIHKTQLQNASKNPSSDSNTLSSNSKGQPSEMMGKNNQTGSNQNIQQNKSFITIVHNDKSVMSEGQITYSAKENTSVLTVNEENSPHIENTHNEGETQQTQRQIHTHIPNNNHQLSISPGAQNTKNHTVQERILKFTDNASPDKVISNEPGANSSQLLGGHTDRNVSPLETLNVNTTKHGVSADLSRNMTTGKLANNSNRDLYNENNNAYTRNNKSTSRDTKQKNFNKNDAHLYIYHLLHKLEELSNRLLNSESTDESFTDNRQQSEDSYEGQEEESDYALPDSTFK